MSTKTISVSSQIHRKLDSLRRLGRYGTYQNAVDIAIDHELQRLRAAKAAPQQAARSTSDAPAPSSESFPALSAPDQSAGLKNDAAGVPAAYPTP